jgi:hypothetical protein
MPFMAAPPTRGLLLVLFAVALGSALAVVSDWDRFALVNEHNLVRWRASPPAALMPGLVWNATLASAAMRASSPCNESETGRHSSENIWVTNRPYSAEIPQFALETWAATGRAYSITKGTCAEEPHGEPGECAPYLLIVNSHVTQLGCDLTECRGEKEGGGEGPRQVIVRCRYSPAADFEETPYETRAAAEVPASSSSLSTSTTVLSSSYSSSTSAATTGTIKRPEADEEKQLSVQGIVVLTLLGAIALLAVFLVMFSTPLSKAFLSPPTSIEEVENLPVEN